MTDVPGNSRLASVDVLRALAVVLMVQQHLGVWLLDLGRNFRILPTLAAVNMLGGAAAPLFVLLAGAGVALGRHGAWVLVGRGALLLLLGYALNLLTPSWFNWGSWYVLHLLGAWLVLAPLVRRLPDGFLFALAGIVLSSAVAAQAWLRTPARLTNARMSDLQLAGGPFRLAAFEGHFPLFPWLCLALVGLWAGRQLRTAAAPSRLFGAALLCGGLAGASRSLLFVLGEAAQELPWRLVTRLTFYPATTTFVLLLTAIGLALLAGLTWLERAGRLRLASWLVPLGRTSLTLLFVHVVVFREGATRLDLRGELSLSETLGCVFGLLVGWMALARIWGRVDYRFSLEWLLRTVGSRRRGRRPDEAQDLPR